MKDYLLGLSQEQLCAIAVGLGEKQFRGRQLADWIYRLGKREIEEFANLPAGFRQELSDQYSVGRSRTEKVSLSSDGTFKLLLRLSDGELIETVGMPYEDRFSCCVSTQSGCAIGCLFCATGISGFRRNLTAGEIIDQVLSVQEYALLNGILAGSAERLSHVVFMGMGEPLLNYEATLRSIMLLNTEMKIGMRHITVSTIGYIPGIYKLAEENLQITLAVSLHAPNDEIRNRLVPGMARYSIKDILQACRDYVKKTGRRVTFEYCLIKKINDSTKNAVQLAELLHGLNCHVNLIPYNQVKDGGLSRPDDRVIRDFRITLEKSGIQVTQREERGSNIQAACGQLRRQSL